MLRHMLFAETTLGVLAQSPHLARLIIKIALSLHFLSPRQSLEWPGEENPYT